MKTPTPYTDEFTLLQNFAQGEKAAFDYIYNTFYFPVYEFAGKYLPTDEDAKDVTAESFTKLWQNRGSYDSLLHIRNSLYLATKNACLNFLEHAKIKEDRHADILRSLITLQNENFYLEEIRAELMQLVYDEVEKLPAKMKQIFLLSYRDGLSPSEIADRLQLSVQTVKNQKQNAINLLKTALGNTPLLLALLLCLDHTGTGSPQLWTA